VKVNGAAKKPADQLRAGDVIAVSRAAAPVSSASAEAGIDFEVVYADDALVVVNKPAGLVVHPAKGHPGGTLVNGLLGRGYFDAKAIEGGGLADSRDAHGYLRPGIVHRIDKGTSGLLVVARTPMARERLKEQFSRHTILREYDAIAVGDVTILEHDTAYGRHPTDRLRFTTHPSDTTHARRAVTRVEIVTRFALATHVRCSLRTGRTHQIRVHLAESGTPVLGDALYGRIPKNPALAELARGLGHQALHARLLGFVHPVTEEPMRFEAPLPRDVADALARLRGGD
jgi:23S rRNA pseudouridine1911/1915/1917 synthase